MNYSRLLETMIKLVRDGDLTFEMAIEMAIEMVAAQSGYSSAKVRDDIAKIVDFPVTNEQRIATTLHNLLCRVSHVSQCSWYDETWSKPGTTRRYYVERAQRVMAKATEEEIKRVVEAIFNSGRTNG